MKKRLTKDKVEVIVGLINGWTDKLTWPLLIAEIKPKFGHYTQQGLHRHLKIKTAYTTRKKYLAGYAKEAPIGGSLLSQKLHERNQRLESEVSYLKDLVTGYDERFVRWSYNAYACGIAVEKLDEPMDPPNRGRTVL